MKCSVCGAVYKSDARFCSQCGSSLGLGLSSCPKCKAEVEAGARFCSMCGTTLLRAGDEAVRTCQSCGFVNPEDTLYCKRCNQKIL